MSRSKAIAACLAGKREAACRLLVVEAAASLDSRAAEAKQTA